MSVRGLCPIAASVRRRSGFVRRGHGSSPVMGAATSDTPSASQCWCNNTAMAADIRRAAGGSEREVSISGTLTPITMPANVAPARYSRFLAKMLPASKFGASKMSASPATTGGVQGGGNALSDQLDRRQCGCFRSIHTQDARQVDGVLQDFRLGGEIRGNIDGSIHSGQYMCLMRIHHRHRQGGMIACPLENRGKARRQWCHLIHGASFDLGNADSKGFIRYVHCISSQK